MQVHVCAWPGAWYLTARSMWPMLTGPVSSPLTDGGYGYSKLVGSTSPPTSRHAACQPGGGAVPLQKAPVWCVRVIVMLLVVDTSQDELDSVPVTHPAAVRPRRRGATCAANTT